MTTSERIVTTLTPPAYGFDQRLLDWSPDGRSLVVSHSSSPANPLGLLLLNLDNAARRVLTQPEVKDGSDVDPRFSPDGRSITFLRSVHRGQQELYSIPVAGGPPKALDPGRPPDQRSRLGSRRRGHLLRLRQGRRVPSLAPARRRRRAPTCRALRLLPPPVLSFPLHVLRRSTRRSTRTATSGNSISSPATGLASSPPPARMPVRNIPLAATKSASAPTAPDRISFGLPAPTAAARSPSLPRASNPPSAVGLPPATPSSSTPRKQANSMLSSVMRMANGR